jgi:hypothetical protein
MIRAEKDLVLLENKDYICFSCWNKGIKDDKFSTKTSNKE